MTTKTLTSGTIYCRFLEQKFAALISNEFLVSGLQVFGWLGQTFWYMLKYIQQIIFFLVGQMKQHQNPIIHIKRCCVSRVTTLTRSCKIYKKLPFLWISSPVLKPNWVPTGSQASLSWQSIIVKFLKKIGRQIGWL